MVRLGNLITQLRGVSYSPKDTSDVACQGYTPILRANNIQDDGLNFDNLVYVKNNKISNNQLLKKGDIVICASSGSKNLVGKAAQVIADTNVSFGAFCKVVRPENIYYAYLGNYFKGKGYRRIISDLSAGININNIRNENINDLTIPLPPLEVQRKIAETLDAASELLEMRKKQLAELDKLIQSVFYDMFGDPVTNEKGWEVRTLGEVAPVIQSNKNINDDKVWLLTLDAVESNSGNILEYSYVSFSSIGSSTVKFDEENILYSKLRPYLNKVVIPKMPGYATSEMLPLKPIKTIIIRDYLAYFLRNKEFVDFISERVSGTKMPRVVTNEFKGYFIPTPPLSLQIQFAETVQKIEEQKALVQKAIDETQALFDSLMGEYFESP